MHDGWPDNMTVGAAEPVPRAQLTFPRVGEPRKKHIVPAGFVAWEVGAINTFVDKTVVESAAEAVATPFSVACAHVCAGVLSVGDPEASDAAEVPGFAVNLAA